MKMLCLPPFFLLSLHLSAQVVINGKIAGLNQEGVNVLYIYALGDTNILDSVRVVDDAFQLELNETVTQIYQVVSKNNTIGFSFWSDGSIIDIEGNLEDIRVTDTNKHFSRYMTNLLIKGSYLQQENNKLFQSIKPELDSLDLWMKTGKLNIALVGEMSDIDKTRVSISDKVTKYIVENPNSELSAFLLFIYGTYEPYIPLSESAYLRTVLGTNAKNSVYAQWILDYKKN